jgi:hypothetical protein
MAPADELRALDISIDSTADELPAGHGTAKEGAKLFEDKGCIGSMGRPAQGSSRPPCNRKPRAASP